MAHPDSIKVIVEDAANISVTSSPTLGNVAVTPETPAVIAINTNSAQVTLSELVGGDPQDGQVIVYDSTTNTFYYDYSSGGAGALVSDLQVTNKDSAVGDAVGVLYEQNDSHESIIRDILSPNSPVVRSATLNFTNVPSGNILPSGRVLYVNSVDFEFMFPSRLSGSNAWTLSLNGTSVGASSSFPSDYGSTIFSRVPFSGSFPYQDHGSVIPFKISSSYDDNGVSKTFSFEDNLYFGRHSFISYSGSESEEIGGLVTNAYYYSAPSSESSSDGYITLQGSENTQSSDNYTWFSIPSDYNISSITEIVSEEGVANRTFSFQRVGGLSTYVNLSAAYSVYLYRSNQKGALSAQSSLRIKLNRS